MAAADGCSVEDVGGSGVRAGAGRGGAVTDLATGGRASTTVAPGARRASRLCCGVTEIPKQSFVASPEFVAEDRMLIAGIVFGRRAERYPRRPRRLPRLLREISPLLSK